MRKISTLAFLTVLGTTAFGQNWTHKEFYANKKTLKATIETDYNQTTMEQKVTSHTAQYTYHQGLAAGGSTQDLCPWDARFVQKHPDADIVTTYAIPDQVVRVGYHNVWNVSYVYDQSSEIFYTPYESRTLDWKETPTLDALLEVAN